MRTPVAGWLALLVVFGLFALVWTTAYHACLTACGTSCKCNAGDAREKPHRTTKQASVSSTVQGSGKQRGRPIAWSTAPHGGPLAGALAP